MFYFIGFERHLTAIALAFALAMATGNLRAASISDELGSAERENLRREARVVVDLLQNHHLSGRAFREMPGGALIGRFLEDLDPRAEFLGADDVELLQRRFARTLKPVYLFRGDLQPAFEIFDRFRLKAGARLDWIQRRLDRGFDFAIEESYDDRRAPELFKTEAEADRHWELTLKEHVLRERLAGRSDHDATTVVKKRFKDAAAAIAAYDPLAVRERFFDSIIRSFDPHSGYFSADSSEEFARQMEQAVVGVGLELRKEDGRCVVVSVHDGGPADLQSEIGPGDIVEAISEDGKPWIETAHLRLREIAPLLRGEAGTRVRLACRQGDDESRREVELIRARMAFGTDRARGFVNEVTGEPDAATRRIGTIRFDSFYSDGEAGKSSVARDIRELLDAMMSSPLDGLVIDLRQNPGGALLEAQALSELFLSGGLMMLSRGPDNRVKEHRLKSGPPVYTGPLIILVGKHSASASEVFARALQHHRRAVLVGAAATFGKGTMQAFVPLARLPNADPRQWGTLRMTTERFYAPDGKSVQVSGASADVVFPAPEDRDFRREGDLPGALPADTIAVPPETSSSPSGTALVSPVVLDKLRTATLRRSAELAEWKLQRRENEFARAAAERGPLTLVLTERECEWADVRARLREVREERRRLARTEKYPGQIHEVREIQLAHAQQETRWRQRESVENASLGRLRPGGIIVENSSGRLVKVRAEQIDFHRAADEAHSLAEELAHAHGFEISTGALEAVLRRIALLEKKSHAEIGRAAGDLSQPQLDALVTTILHAHTELPGESPALDVWLREAQRLAADWAALTTLSP